MDSFIHLTIEGREKNILLSRKGYSIRKIASIIKRNPSTVSRELNKSKINETYNPFKAQKSSKIVRI